MNVLFLVLLTGFLAAYNNATNLLRLPDAWYVPLNLTVAAALVVLARHQGLTFAQLGLSPANLGAGLRWGGAVAAMVAVALAVASLVPVTQPLLEDQRVAGLGLAGLMFQTLVRIPLGTALFEEVAFRGVLLAAWERHTSLALAVVASSLVFGVWHIGPTIVALQVNAVPLDAGGWAAVAGSVAVTAVAGVLFCLLRLHTGSLLAPIVVHIATNSFATVAAFLAQRGS